MVARVEAKSRARELEVQRKLEEGKPAATSGSSWRRDAPKDDAWRKPERAERPERTEPAAERRPTEPWRTGGGTNIFFFYIYFFKGFFSSTYFFTLWLPR